MNFFFLSKIIFEKLKFEEISYNFPIDLHKLDEWKTLIKQDLGACEWMESESEESGSESGSDGEDDDDESDDDDSDTSGMDTD